MGKSNKPSMKEFVALLAAAVVVIALFVGFLFGGLYGLISIQDYNLNRSYNKKYRVYVNESWVQKGTPVKVYFKLSGTLTGTVTEAIGINTELHYRIKTDDGETLVGLGDVTHIEILKQTPK